MRWSAASTRLVAWLALGCHVLVASGLPLPVAPRFAGDAGVATARTVKDRSRPFPCMDKPCGCATAEQCFASCCCHSPAERLAWARAHAVEPAVLAALERRVAAPAAASPSCCAATRAEPSCCATSAATPADPEAADVCSDYRSLTADAVSPAEPRAPHADETAGPRVVILRDMLACGGILTAWLACGTALPPPPRVASPTHDAPAGSIALDDVVAPSCSAAPAVPPPRVG
jgi:hypothetical protein